MRKIISKILTVSLMVLPLTGFLVLSAFHAPQIYGYDDSFIVNSDSMEPAITEGALIFSDEVRHSEINVDDVITFRKEHRNGSIMITHRVIERREFNGTYYYRTKGDANSGSDEGFIDESRVIGEVRSSFPEAGRLVRLFRSELGLILILVPSILILLKEFSIINRELKWERLNKSRNLDGYGEAAEVK